MKDEELHLSRIFLDWQLALADELNKSFKWKSVLVMGFCAIRDDELTHCTSPITGHLSTPNNWIKVN